MFSKKFCIYLERRSSGASGSEEDTVKQRDTPPASPNASTCRDRRSPKRQHSVSEKSFKKLKLDDNKEEQYKRISPKPYHIHPSWYVRCLCFVIYEFVIVAYSMSAFTALQQRTRIRTKFIVYSLCIV